MPDRFCPPTLGRPITPSRPDTSHAGPLDTYARPVNAYVPPRPDWRASGPELDHEAVLLPVVDRLKIGLVVGTRKGLEWKVPVMYELPLASTAMPEATSIEVPPNLHRDERPPTPAARQEALVRGLDG